MRATSLISSLGCLLALSCGASRTLGGEPESKHVKHRLEWDERWHRFRPIEYVTTAATAVASGAVFYFASPHESPSWTGPILFDTVVRNAFRLHTRSGMETAASASDVAAYMTPIWSLIDSLVLPTVDRNFDLLWQLGMMDAQAYALSGLATSTLYDTTGRARPSYAACKAGSQVEPLCNSGEFASFPSGHTAVSMTGAGLLCAHHEELPLYGGGAADVAPCVGAIVFSAGVGMLRVMADRHYASDVLTGGAIGFFSGYALPRLLHYWRRAPNELVDREGFKLALALGTPEGKPGLQFLGMF